MKVKITKANYIKFLFKPRLQDIVLFQQFSLNDIKGTMRYWHGKEVTVSRVHRYYFNIKENDGK